VVALRAMPVLVNTVSGLPGLEALEHSGRRHTEGEVEEASVLTETIKRLMAGKQENTLRGLLQMDAH
jgi:hypothetical protein